MFRRPRRRISSPPRNASLWQVGSPARDGHPVALLLAILAILWPSEAEAQAWVLPADGYYLKFSASYLATDEEFDAQGNRREMFADDPLRSGGSFREISVTAYAEYGLRPWLTAVARLPFKVVTSTETVSGQPGFPSVRSEPTNGGFGDVLVSIRTPIIRRPFAMSFQGGTKLPLGYEQEPDNGGPSLGTGDVDVEGHIAIGFSLYPLPAYIGAGAGYRIRGGPLNDELLYDAEAGYTLGRLFLKVRIDGLKNTVGVSADPGPQAELGTVADIVVGDQDIWKLNTEMAYALNGRIQINTEIFHTLAGRATVAGTTVSLGLVMTR